jgi:Putative DNA-binding domain
MPVPVADLGRTTEAMLQRLVGIAEDETLDFKRDSYGTNDKAKQELCKDISAMANGRGGDIVLGVGEQDNVASEVVGLEQNIGDEIQRLQNIVLMAVEPRIVGIQFQPVDLASGRHALVIRVPQSMDAPHRVTHSGINRFCVRHTSDTYEASLVELRQMFERSSNEFDRAEAFINERMGKLNSGAEICSLSGKSEGFAALHMVPFGFHKRKVLLDVSQLEQDGTCFPPIGSLGSLRMYVPDGFVTRRGNDLCYGYTAVLRTGALEATKARLCIRHAALEKAIHAPKLRSDLLIAIEKYLSDFRKYGLQGPWLIGLTLGGCSEASLLVPRGSWEADAALGVQLSEATLSFPLVVVEGSSGRAELTEALKPIFDAMWQAAGLPKSD